MRKDPLTPLRQAMRRERNRTRATIARLRRNALIVFAAMGAVGILLLQNGAAPCLGSRAACNGPALQGASVALGGGAARPNPAMQAAIAARAAAQTAAAQTAAARQVAQRSAAQTPRINPALAAALRASRAQQGQTGDGVFFTTRIARD